MKKKEAKKIVDEVRAQALNRKEKLTGRFRVEIFKRIGDPDEWLEEYFDSFKSAKRYADNYLPPFMSVMIDGEIEDKRPPWNGWMPVTNSGHISKGEHNIHPYCRTVQ